MRREFGDFQTPLPLAEAIVRRLCAEGQSWERVLEPTCGRGSFVQALLKSSNPPPQIVGLEIHPGYVQEAVNSLSCQTAVETDLRVSDIFSMDLGKDLAWKHCGPLLVIGNPPWVTNSELGALNSANLPRKSNLKGLSGLEAMTGASNFDISESIWIKLIRELLYEKPTIALLCKTSVARNVIAYCKDAQLPVSGAKLFHIDAPRWFEAAVSACLFSLDVNRGISNYDVAVFDSLEDQHPLRMMTFQGPFLIPDSEQYSKVRYVEGRCPFVWRQGIKHDAASVVELKRSADRAYINKLGQIVTVEDDFLYPLLKSSDLAGDDFATTERWVIVPQKKLNENLFELAITAPRLWAYLNANKATFDERKSSIYKQSPVFSYFGIGDYSFAKYKVAVSGFYKKPRFRVLVPLEEKPVMVDDTCYFLPFDTLEDAAAVAMTLNSDPVLTFLEATAFSDSKRPITKRLLQRIDLPAAAAKRGLPLPMTKTNQLALL